MQYTDADGIMQESDLGKPPKFKKEWRAQMELTPDKIVMHCTEVKEKYILCFHHGFEFDANPSIKVTRLQVEHDDDGDFVATYDVSYTFDWPTPFDVVAMMWQTWKDEDHEEDTTYDSDVLERVDVAMDAVNWHLVFKE